MRKLHRLKRLHPRRTQHAKDAAAKQHRRFCWQVHLFAERVFAVRSQLDPYRLARYAQC